MRLADEEDGGDWARPLLAETTATPATAVRSTQVRTLMDGIDDLIALVDMVWETWVTADRVSRPIRAPVVHVA
jgi:hypothetical protein